MRSLYKVKFENHEGDMQDYKNGEDGQVYYTSRDGAEVVMLRLQHQGYQKVRVVEIPPT